MIRLPKEPFDPVLKAAMEEIKAVLEKHDIAGIAILQSKTHGEWVNHISPSWSAAFLDTVDGKDVIRFRCLAKDYPSKEAHREAISITCGMILGFSGGANRIAQNMDSLMKLVSKVVEVEHGERDSE